MKRIAIIPARGGSKRIPRKNIKEFLGKPIIAFSIEAALASDLFDEVMVSTDDQEIASVSRQYGAHVPFIRSEATSNDMATTSAVLLEVLESYLRSGMTFVYGCCIYPTAPFIKPHRLKEAWELLMAGSYDSVFPIVRYGYPIWRSLTFEQGKVAMNWPEHMSSRSQDLPAAFHDAGQFYWFNTESFLKNLTIVSSNTGAIELNEFEVQDIDNPIDWNLAELKYSILNDSNTNSESKNRFPG